METNMTSQTRTPTTGGAVGANQKFSFGDEEFHIAEAAPQSKAPSAASAGAIAALQRDFIAEALRIAAVKAAHAADDIELGDDLAVERGISLTITHLKAAAAEFRQMQAGSL
jgi:hypothetical protein